ncbi:MAG: hypothetical protein QOF13_368 [Solirubrobacterales bacterium]|jgi:hypothetical protein|nr:hypothetical protein [Solirubrobacterales bacterium]
MSQTDQKKTPPLPNLIRVPTAAVRSQRAYPRPLIKHQTSHPRHTMNPEQVFAFQRLGDWGRFAVSRRFGWTLAWRPAADFGTASPCGNRLYGRRAECVRDLAKGDFLTKKAGHSSSSLDSRCRGNCPTTLTPTLSNFSLRRTLPAPAVCRAERSTERLHEASCVLPASAIGSGFSPASWTAGSERGRSRLILRLGPKGRTVLRRSLAKACAPCSIRRATDRRMR